MLLPVKLKAFEDKTFEWVRVCVSVCVCVPDMAVITPQRTYACTQKLMHPPSTWYIKQAVGIEKGSSNPGHEYAGYITLKQLYHIAEVKKLDQPGVSVKSVFRSLMGTAHSMGVQVVTDEEAMQRDAQETPPPKADKGKAGKKK